MEQKAEWVKFLQKVDFMKVVPYHLLQEISESVLEQVYTAGETIYDVGEKDIDALYFVAAGKIKLEARFNIV